MTNVLISHKAKAYILNQHVLYFLISDEVGFTFLRVSTMQHPSEDADDGK